MILTRLDLTMEQVRGQGYHGASNMCGHLTGVAARVKEHNPLALYVLLL